MRSRFKQHVFLFVIIFLILSMVLAGCSSEKTDSGASKKVNSLQIIETGDHLPPKDEDIINKKLSEKLGVNIDLSVTASGDDYKNNINTRLAGGDYPDLFSVIDHQTLQQYAEKGLLLDLSAYKDKLKTTIDFIGEESLKKGTIDGKLYAIAARPTINYNTYWVRKDWLDKLGLKEPKTINDLMKVAEAFTNDDPDGNGKKDTYGISGGQLNAFAPIFGAFGVGMPGDFYVKDGKLVNAYFDPDMKPALSFIKDLVSQGVVDPDLMANTGLQHQDKAFQGKVGIVWLDWPNITKDQFVKQIKEANPKAKWVQIAAPKGPGGQYNGSWDTGATPAIFAIPKGLKNDPKKLDKVFELLNYVSSKEGNRLVQFGVEGRDYDLKDGKVVTKPKLDEEGGYFWLYQFTRRPEKEYLKTKFPKQQKYITFADNQPQIQALNSYVNIPDGYNPADADAFAQQEITKFIYGKRSLDEYDQFLKKLKTTFKYQSYLDSAKKQLKDLDLIK
ncbi:putative aldouronate transport system substrate-binding protein [Pullulanibacillus pueri]|uniref:Putative ABC transporter peptide-binding protein YtcQ n=1 Tax=Pullulanibacillus pueri TaxID=1437324 RepID=A0A8J2ZUY8_9BACL|nr:extracellular solute-binding protein [Pullulanibacillus pueri]MBM7682227.1 putative aldouronate transport system substrate-binding protein [Pullulanibacillus pueri]GGH80525.1 putative ABC transporter peptide-binding protein YtcQ [Pullulanibacillus pueri]